MQKHQCPVYYDTLCAQSVVMNGRLKQEEEQNDEQQKTIPTDDWFNAGSVVGRVRRDAG